MPCQGKYLKYFPFCLIKPNVLYKTLNLMENTTVGTLSLISSAGFIGFLQINNTSK
jgi:hypothetical protein